MKPFRAGIHCLFATLLLASTSQAAPRCEAVFLSTDSSTSKLFDASVFAQAQKLYHNFANQALYDLRPQRPEEKLAWLEELGRRSQGSTQFEPTPDLQDQTRSTRMKKILRPEAGALTYKRILSLVRLGYLDRSSYAQSARLLLKGQWNDFNEFYIGQRLEYEIRRKGLLAGLELAGVIDLNHGLNSWRQTWDRNQNQIQFIFQSALSVAALHYDLAQGTAPGGTLPVWRFIQARTLPQALLQKVLNEGIEPNLELLRQHYGIRSQIESANWFLSKTFTYATVLVAALLLTNQALTQAGLSPGELFDDLMTDPVKLQNLVLEQIVVDAKELGLPIDLEKERAQLQTESVRQLHGQLHPSL